MIRFVVVTGAALGVLASTAGAQDAPAASALNAPAKSSWTIQFEPAAWFVAPGGEVTLPGSPDGVKMTALVDLNLDSPRWTPSGELHLRSGDWRITVSALAFSASDRGATPQASGQVGSLTYAAGDRLRSSLDLFVFEATAAYTVPERLDGEDFTGTLDLLGGFRVYDLDFEVEGPAGRTGADEFFGHPFVGVKLTMDIVRDFTVDLQLDAGYWPTADGGTMGYNIFAGFAWRPTPHVGVQIGYRDLAYFLRRGEEPDRFDYEGALQGLYLGAVVRF